MTDQQQPNNPELVKKLGEIHLKLQHYREFSLDNGKWNPEHVIALVDIREEAVKLVKQAILEGFNRGTVVEMVLADLGINANYSMF